MIVVPVFTTSCQVSLKPNSGPVRAQMTMMAAAATKVPGRPAPLEVASAIRENQDVDRFDFFMTACWREGRILLFDNFWNTHSPSAWSRYAGWNDNDRPGRNRPVQEN